MWFIGVEVEQETSAPPPKKNPGSAPETKPFPATNVLDWSGASVFTLEKDCSWNWEH